MVLFMCKHDFEFLRRRKIDKSHVFCSFVANNANYAPLKSNAHSYILLMCQCYLCNLLILCIVVAQNFVQFQVRDGRIYGFVLFSSFILSCIPLLALGIRYQKCIVQLENNEK